MRAGLISERRFASPPPLSSRSAPARLCTSLSLHKETHHSPHQALIPDAQQDAAQVRVPAEQAAGQGGPRSGECAGQAAAAGRGGQVKLEGGGAGGQGGGIHGRS